MEHCVHSRLALRTLLKLRRCAEGWIAREWTCWKPHNITHKRTFPSRPPAITRTVCNTASGRNDVVRHGVGKPKTYTPGLPAALKPPHQSLPIWQAATNGLCCLLARGLRFSQAVAQSLCCRIGSASAGLQCQRIHAPT